MTQAAFPVILTAQEAAPKAVTEILKQIELVVIIDKEKERGKET